MAEDERLLLEAFRSRRDEASFRTLYRRHSPMLFALAIRLSGSSAQAEELTQETWVRAVERHETFSGQSRYSTWLAGILVNCFREASRQPARRETSLDHDDGALARSSVAVFPTPGVRAADPIDVERALARLPEGYREVVLLHDVNGYTHREIAALLGIAEGTSKSQLMRGRARLRELLTQTTRSGEGQRERGKP